MSSRRHLNVNLDNDDHAQIAAGHLVSMESNRAERLEVSYPLASIFPSPSNPRRISLDNAGVTSARIEQLAIKPRESLASWSARLEQFLDELESKGASPKSHAVWSELFDLAISIYTSDLIQPITIKPDGEIIAGERRWTACLLAGKTHNRVIIRLVTADQESLLRLIENLRRSDLSIAETALQLRIVMEENTGQPCGPDNELLSMEKIQSVLGAGQTQSAYYRAICRLPEGDSVLAQIVAGGYTSLRTAYEDASKRVRELQANPGKRPTPLNDGSTTPPETPPPARKPSPPMPLMKARIPGTEGGRRFIEALANIEGLGESTLERIKAISSGWTGAPEKARKKMLSEALEKLFADLDRLDDEPEPEA